VQFILNVAAEVSPKYVMQVTTLTNFNLQHDGCLHARNSVFLLSGCILDALKFWAQTMVNKWGFRFPRLC